MKIIVLLISSKFEAREMIYLHIFYLFGSQNALTGKFGAKLIFSKVLFLCQIKTILESKRILEDVEKQKKDVVMEFKSCKYECAKYKSLTFVTE